MTILVFLSLLPLTKHFHIITAIPNVFLAKLPPRGVQRPLAITQVPAAPVAALDSPSQGTVGVASLADLSWKQVLDTFSCTECGRCTDVCPATASGSPLAPRQLILDLRDRLYHHPDEQRNAKASAPLIADDVLWSCTTCMACVEACPVGIEHVPTIIDMRRNLVDQGEMDPLLQQTLQNYAQQGNSYGKSVAHARPLGQEPGLQDPRRAQGARAVPVVRRRLRVLRRARAARLAVDRADPARRRACPSGCSTRASATPATTCAGSARRACSSCSSSRTWARSPTREYEAIFTTDPHSLNTLRNEYPQYGLDKPVYHYTELLADLVARGVISLRTPLTGTRVTYHDPCYLARYNRITEAPRKLIEAIGAELVEMPRHGTDTFCCGAGGGRIWMKDGPENEERPSEQRIREAQTLGDLDYFLVTCPKDLAMYSDAVKVVGADFEVAELTC